MKRVLVMITLLLVVPVLVFPNGMNLNNAGTKAIGMGGAFVGLADDYSAVYYNPAGLTQIEGTSINLFAVDLIPSATYKYSAAGIDAKTTNGGYPSGAFGVFMDLGEKMKVGLYMDVPSGIGTEWDGKELKNLSGPSQTIFDWSSKVAVIHFGPALAYDVTEKLSLGLSVNIAYGQMKMELPQDVLAGAAPGHDGYVDAQYSDDASGMGYGLTIGALYKVTDKLSAGLSLRTKNTVKFSGDAEVPLLALLQAPTKSEFDRDVTFPLWIGAGIAYRATDKLTITADVQMTQWESTHEKLATEFKNAAWIALFGKSYDVPLDWENTLSLRIGGMYKITPCLDVMAGFYHDQDPGVDETALILLPCITHNALCFGLGWHRGPMSVQMSVEYLIGTEKEISAPLPAMSGIHNMNIIAPSVALSYSL